MSDFKTSSRTSRSSDLRSHDGRVSISGTRAPVSFATGSRFNVPKEVIESDPDHSYEYIAYQSGGVDLTSEYDEAVYRRGFAPVERSQHPTLSRNDIANPFGKKQEDNLVKQGGQILMKRPIEVKKAEDDFFNEFTARQNYIKQMHSNRDPGSTKMLADERSWQK